MAITVMTGAMCQRLQNQVAKENPGGTEDSFETDIGIGMHFSQTFTVDFESWLLHLI